MAIVTPLKKMIQEIEIKYRSAVSESTWRKITGSINFINTYQYLTKQFPINGEYDFATGDTFVDGIQVFEFDAEIINVWAYNCVNGTSGTTQLDLKVKPKTGGSFTSILSVKPSITTASGGFVHFGVGDTKTGCTAPVLSTTNVNAGDAIRIDVISTMVNAQNCGLIVHYRPR